MVTEIISDHPSMTIQSGTMKVGQSTFLPTMSSDPFSSCGTAMLLYSVVQWKPALVVSSGHVSCTVDNITQSDRERECLAFSI